MPFPDVCKPLMRRGLSLESLRWDDRVQQTTACSMIERYLRITN